MLGSERYIVTGQRGGGGESKSHKLFKEFIAANPKAIGLTNKLDKVEIEYVLPSADTIDVLFYSKKLKIGVEVKSKISSERRYSS